MKRIFVKLLYYLIVSWLLTTFVFAQQFDKPGKSIYSAEEGYAMAGAQPIDPETQKILDRQQANAEKEYYARKGLQKTTHILTQIDSLDMRSIMGPIASQGEEQCSYSCWAHAAAGALEGQLNMALGLNHSNGIALDAMNLVLSYYGSCHAGSVELGMEQIQTERAVSLTGSSPNLEGTHWTIASYFHPTTDTGWGRVRAIKQALHNHGPVTASFKLYDDFYSFFANPDNKFKEYRVTDTSHYNGTSMHSVVLVGHGVNERGEYWICKNSVGNTWADSGYFRIAFFHCYIDWIENYQVTLNSNCYAKIIPLYFPSVASALSVSCGPDEWIHNNANIEFNGSLTLPAGVTLAEGPGYTMHIDPGFTITFSDGGSLVIFGNLQADGWAANYINLNFTSPNSTRQNGIIFRSGSSGSLSRCNIQNAFKGVFCTGTSTPPTISYCTISNTSIGIHLNNVQGSSYSIDNNTITSYSAYGIEMYNSSPITVHDNKVSTTNSYCTGLYCLSGSGPFLYNNLFKDNTNGSGISCYSNSPAHVYMYYGGHGHNVIKNNYYGISCGYSSNADAGTTSHPGVNSIYNNTYAISAQYSSNVDAQCNWWNRLPLEYPNHYRTEDFTTSNGGSITYSPADTSTANPNAGIGKVAMNLDADLNNTDELLDQAMNDPSIQLSPISDPEFAAALENLHQAKFDDAMAQYKLKIQKEKDTQRKCYALVQLAECYRSLGRKDFSDYLNKEVRPGLNKNNALLAKSLELEALFLTGSGEYNKAIKNYDQLRSDFAQNEEIYKNALFNSWYVTQYMLGDDSKANSLFAELKNKYPDDNLTIFGMVQRGEIDSPGKANASLKNAQKNEGTEKASAVPKTYGLNDNYPNPFNPTTKIGYQIPQEGFVSIRVIDALGREVASLVNQTQKPGNYTVQFNASNLSSGVYFYQMKVNDYTSIKKMMLLK